MSIGEGSTGVGFEWLVYEAAKPDLPMCGTGYRSDPEGAKSDATAELEQHTDAVAIVRAVAREHNAQTQQSRWNGETSQVGVCVKGGVKWMDGTKLDQAIGLLSVRRGLREL